MNAIKKMFTMTPMLMLSAMLLWVGAGCNEEEKNGHTATEGETYKIMVTTGMIHDIVAAVAGDKAEVSTMMGADVDPHLYKPTMKDVEALGKSDVIIYNGHHLEGKLDDVLGKLKKKKVVALAEKLSQEDVVIPEDAEGHADPHAWMDVMLWAKLTDEVAKVLAEYDPANKAYYEANAKLYVEKLVALDAYIKTAVATIPQEQRVLITAHDAFNYFSEAYGVEVRGVQGISTLSEAGMKDVEDLVSFIVSRNVQAVFIESSVSEKNINILLELCKNRGHALKMGGLLYSDAMGPEGTYEGTYIGMMDHNATTIVKALGGQVEATGFQGKLTPQPPSAGHYEEVAHVAD